jgi:hypothetical protein
MQVAHIYSKKILWGESVFLVNNHSHPKKYDRVGMFFWLIVFISPKIPLKSKKKGGGRVGMGLSVFLDLKWYFVMIWVEVFIPQKNLSPQKYDIFSFFLFLSAK